MQDRAVSSVVGVVLMIGLTVGLASFAYVGLQDEMRPREHVTMQTENIGHDQDNNQAIDAVGVTIMQASESSPLMITAEIQGPNRQIAPSYAGLAVGEEIRLPCLQEGPHSVTLSNGGQAVTSFVIDCSEALQPVQREGAHDQGGHDPLSFPSYEEACQHWISEHGLTEGTFLKTCTDGLKISVNGAVE